MTTQIFKYPRTRHLEGSRCQPGDEDLEAVPFAELQGRSLVVEEKVDGANAAISFSAAGTLLLQSRGHYLTGGAREKHFTLFKQWARVHAQAFFARIADRYVVYGEWLYAKHTMFYDRLPHFFLEFDVLEIATGEFLSTPRRQELLRGLPLVSVRVLHSGRVKSLKVLKAMLGRSAFISDDHRAQLRSACAQLKLDVERVEKETDSESTMEGLYIKVEEHGVVQERYKFVRSSFLTAVENSEGHWLSRPIVPNQLQDGVELFGPTERVES